MLSVEGHKVIEVEQRIKRGYATKRGVCLAPPCCLPHCISAHPYGQSHTLNGSADLYR